MLDNVKRLTSESQTWENTMSERKEFVAEMIRVRGEQYALGYLESMFVYTNEYGTAIPLSDDQRSNLNLWKDTV